MKADPVRPTPPQPEDQGQSADPASDQHSENILAVREFYTQEERKISHSQRALEHLSNGLGKPGFLGLIVLFVALWILANTLLPRPFDRAPFPWLQGIIGLGALLTATVVLTKQNRLARLAEQRAHLDLKLTLLTEQKAAKLIDLLEELRRDMPNVKNRHDPGAASLQKPMDPDLVLAALDESLPGPPAAAPVVASPPGTP